MIKKTHYDYLDVSKGIGIILVVLGHGMFPNHFLIDSFHMPLFFILAGITFKNPDTTSFKSWLCKKVERILVPYLFFMIVSGIMEAIIGRVNPDSPFNAPLWFLQTLFASIVIYGTLSYTLNRLAVTVLCLAMALCGYLVYSYTHISTIIPFFLCRTLFSIPFIHLGILLSEYVKCSGKKVSTIVGFSSIIIYAICFMFVTKHYAIQGTSFVFGNIFTYNLILPWLLAITGSISVIFASKLLHTLKILQWGGKTLLL